MRKILRFFIFVLLFHRIRAESGKVTEQGKTHQHENNLEKVTTANTVQDKPSGNEEKNIAVKKIVDGDKNNESKSIQHHRPSRLAMGELRRNLECVSCSGSGTSFNDEVCYNGEILYKTKCADAEACFTELHPQYIKRGCMLPSSVNRTFVCKCPLCNDKPAEDVTYYEYKTISDWQFDNQRLQEPILGLELLCKVCETTGRSRVADKICSNGSRADYMLCGHNQLCFVNINRQLDYVARGCIEMPAFNSMYYFCNSSACNTKTFENPARTKRAMEVYDATEEPKSFATIVTPQYVLIFLKLLLLFLGNYNILK